MYESMMANGTEKSTTALSILPDMLVTRLSRASVHGLANVQLSRGHSSSTKLPSARRKPLAQRLIQVILNGSRSGTKLERYY